MSEQPAGTRAAMWLGLAAAPVFALMALMTAVSGGPARILCSPASEAIPIDGMTLMYLLMCVFHSPPWLNLVSGRRRIRTWDGSKHGRSI